MAVLGGGLILMRAVPLYSKHVVVLPGRGMEGGSGLRARIKALHMYLPHLYHAQPGGFWSRDCDSGWEGLGGTAGSVPRACDASGTCVQGFIRDQSSEYGIYM